MSDLVFIGIAIIFAGFLVVFLGMLASGKSPEEGERRKVRGGGVIMVGPIPIIFGSDPKWTSIAIVLAIVLIVIVFFSGVLIRQ